MNMPRQAALPTCPPRLLFSYAYFNRGRAERIFDHLTTQAPHCFEVLVDSGAFTNYTSRLRQAKGLANSAAVFTREEYAEWLLPRVERIWGYVSLDEIGNRDATFDNLDYLLTRGLRPMPVYVQGMTANDLPSLMAIDGGRLCVAGGVQTAAGYIERRYRAIFEMSRRQARIHGLGYGRHPGIMEIPIISADSSAYVNGSRFGTYTFYDPAAGFVRFQRNELREAVEPKDVAYRNLCASWGVTMDDLLGPASRQGGPICVSALLTVHAYLRYQAHMHQIGLRYFFAMGELTWLVAIAAVLAARDKTGTHLDLPRARALAERYRSPEKLDETLDWVVEVLHTAPNHDLVMPDPHWLAAAAPPTEDSA